jgi:VWFA-related protein
VAVKIIDFVAVSHEFLPRKPLYNSTPKAQNFFAAPMSRGGGHHFMLIYPLVWFPGWGKLLRSTVLILSIPLGSVLLGLSQDTAKEAPKSTSVITVNEVSMNLVVRDKKGKLIPDLKPEDLSVTDAGTPVKLSSLRLVTGESGEHFVTLMFDQMDSSASMNAREIAGKILKLVPDKGFLFAVTKAEGRLMLYHDFSADRQRLSSALRLATEEAQPGTGSGAEAAEKRLIAVARKGTDESGTQVSAAERATAQALLAALQESQRVLQELHTQPGLAGLLALSRAEQRMSGRKTIFYFAQGLRTDASAGERLRDVIGAANRAGVSIFAIDANALTAQADQALVAMAAIGGQRAAQAQAPRAPAFTGSGPSSQPVAAPPPGLAPMVSNQYDRFESADPSARKSPLAVLAESTGGAYVPAGDDIKKPVRRMIEDMTTYYEASYVPPVENYDGQFRAVAVKPVRAGLKITSRAGYFALPPDSERAIRPFEAPLLKLLSQSQLPSDVEFHAQVLRLGELPTGNENTLVVEVPIGDLESRNDPNTDLYSVHVAVAVQVKNKAGVTVEHFGEDIPRHGSLAAKESQPGVITMQRHFTAEPGEYVLEAAVLDQNSGKAGAQRVQFEVPSTSSGPFLSDLSVVQRIDPVPREADPDEPMRYANGRVVPSVSQKVPQGTKEISFFFVVHPDSEASEQPTLEMEVLRSGEPIGRVPLTLRQTSGPSAIPYMASIQSASLPPGDYQVVEKLTHGGKTTERNLAFQIQGSGQEVTQSAGTESATTAKEDAEATTGLQVPETDAAGRQRVLITALPADKMPTPKPEQLEAIIKSARTRALDYSKALPNFICVEITNRSVDADGNGKWKPRDSLAELLSYHDNSETRTTLEVNGKRSSLKRAELNSSWPLSVGEFGAMLNLVFQPSSKTDFEWKEAASLNDGSGTVQVLDYRVSAENATIVLSQGNEQAAVGFHGQVYIDAPTGGVRRITLNADGIPRTFAVRAASMTVDYDFVGISGRDYLMPVRSSVTLVKGKKKVELNEITFRNYRRFSSRTKIKMMQ